MFRLRDIAIMLLPVLVVLWATVAVLGGAFSIARQAEPPDGNTAAKAGLGLCAVSVAIFARKAVRRVSLPPLVAGFGPRVSGPRPQGLPVRVTSTGPPGTGPPIFLLIRVSRT